jgi:hypothetical protein
MVILFLVKLNGIFCIKSHRHNFPLHQRVGEIDPKLDFSDTLRQITPKAEVDAKTILPSTSTTGSKNMT